MTGRSALLRGLCLGALTAWPVAAQVVPDGATATGVTIGADGRVTVGVAAPGANGISANSFTRFDVPKAGVDLDNRTASARTILGEVTGTAPSRIEGQVAVLGQRAHVVLANPNGITVDGGGFVNTGRVALTTGTPGRVERQIAPGVFQSNVTARVEGGTITVEGGGLAGQMDAVELIAERIRLAGPVTVEGEGGTLSLRAGLGTTEFDSATLPGNTGIGWARTDGAPGGSGGVVVDILSAGAMGAHRIGIAVTGAGAGVRHAGAARAGAGGFTLTAGGAVEIAGGRIDSEGVAAIAARSLRADAASVTAGAVLVDTDKGQALSGTDLLAGGGVALTGGGAFRLSGGTVQGGTATLSFDGSVETASTEADLAILFASAGALSVRAGGDIRNDRGRLLASDGIGLTAGGDIANVTADPDLGAEIVHTVDRGRGLAFWRPRATHRIVVDGHDIDPDRLATITAGGGVTAEAGGAILNHGGEINANGGDVVLTAKTLETAAIRIGRTDATLTCTRGCRVEGRIGGSLAGGQIAAAGDVTARVAGTLTNDGGRVVALGAIDIAARETLAAARQAPLLVERRAGLWNLWRGRSGWIALRDQFGAFAAQGGDLVLAGRTRVDGGSLDASGEVTAETEIVRAPEDRIATGGTGAIGALGGLAPTHR